MPIYHDIDQLFNGGGSSSHPSPIRATNGIRQWTHSVFEHAKLHQYASPSPRIDSI